MAARTLAAVSASTRRSSVDGTPTKGAGQRGGGPRPQLLPGQVQSDTAQPGAKPGRALKAVQADQRLGGCLLEYVGDILGPVEKPAYERPCYWTVAVKQDDERRLVARARLEHQLFLTDLS